MLTWLLIPTNSFSRMKREEFKGLSAAPLSTNILNAINMATDPHSIGTPKHIAFILNNTPQLPTPARMTL